MPELPDIELYLYALRPRILGETLEAVRLASPFLVRSFEPPIAAVVGRRVLTLRRLGKRIVWELDGGLFLIFHLMIAGRLRWKPKGTAVPGKVGLAAFDFPGGTLLLTEAGSKRRASLYVAHGEASLVAHDPGGVEPLDVSREAFAAALRRENHTLKRALTDPHVIGGIGNAYSDEILLDAQLSPMKLASHLTDDDVVRLHASTVRVLSGWRDRLIDETGDLFPEKVTAFREGMLAHGRFGKPCPRCGTPIQRIRYASNEANYCPRCQTGGKLLADRSLSRLLKDDWPRTLDELERRKGKN
ncbi:MAG: formamidopyrimidine-DNA glycosylase [Acidobacteria bacterium]|nr:formamidopyrimidine-DNA glycosylase [Acidobacteriota bacterium]